MKVARVITSRIRNAFTQLRGLRCSRSRRVFSTNSQCKKVRAERSDLLVRCLYHDALGDSLSVQMALGDLRQLSVGSVFFLECLLKQLPGLRIAK